MKQRTYFGLEGMWGSEGEGGGRLKRFKEGSIGEKDRCKQLAEKCMQGDRQAEEEEEEEFRTEYADTTAYHPRIPRVWRRTYPWRE